MSAFEDAREPSPAPGEDRTPGPAPRARRVALAPFQNRAVLALAENVGMGRTGPSLQAAFMKSPEHRRNMLDPTYTEVGIGVVVVNHTMFVVEDFRRRG